MNPTTFEVFDPKKYLPEIQFAFDLSPSLGLASPNFKPSDIMGSLYPSKIPNLTDLVSYVKKKIVPDIISTLRGLFDVKLDTSTTGLSVDEPSLGDNGLNLGDFSSSSTMVFPPKIDLDRVQGFNFDISVDIEDGPKVSPKCLH